MDIAGGLHHGLIRSCSSPLLPGGYYHVVMATEGHATYSSSSIAMEMRLLDDASMMHERVKGAQYILRYEEVMRSRLWAAWGAASQCLGAGILLGLPRSRSTISTTKLVVV
eukprot:scaffold30389_cov70-Attheya_sp.AAC.1